MKKIIQNIEKALDRGNGILRLKPAWVARNFIPPGKRLGLPEKDYYAGKRGWITERWLASTTKADNAVGPKDEGLSYISIDFSEDIKLKDVVENAHFLIFDKEYYRKYKGLSRLAKVFDFGTRIPFHLHQMEKDARLLERNSKDEAYYFPEGFDMGKNPETFFGLHPFIKKPENHDILLPYLEKWDSDLILKHSRAYLNVRDEGFLLSSGILHAPGTALTIELQEDSDVAAILQAKVAGKIISKDLLFKDVTEENRLKFRERAVLCQINWEGSCDPYFYEHNHLKPEKVETSLQEAGEEYWIYYGTDKFSGKKLVIKEGKTYKSKDKGLYNVFVLKGEGTFDSLPVKAGNFELDELMVSHNAATRTIDIKNTGKGDMVIIKFFGPGINKDCPGINF